MFYWLRVFVINVGYKLYQGYDRGFEVSVSANISSSGRTLVDARSANNQKCSLSCSTASECSPPLLRTPAPIHTMK